MNEVPDREAFNRSHRAFLRWAEEKSGGETFRSFDHPYFVRDEVAYKHLAYADGAKALHLDRWKAWRRSPGKILGAVKAACEQRVSRNLLEQQRHGPKSCSHSPLFLATTTQAVAGLEEALFEYLLGGDSSAASFGPRFDAFASYLKAHRLGCKWPFLAYLAFLLEPRSFMPVRPERFDALLTHYGLSTRLASNISWKAYEELLRVTDFLRNELSIYGTPSLIEIQSYMWVVANLVNAGLAPDDEGTAIDFAATLKARQCRADERERIGLAGELFVFEELRRRLLAGNRPDLAEATKLVADDSAALGYDIRSFDDLGREIHVEVKSTTRGREQDYGFFISENEIRCAKNDPAWRLFRVWSVDKSPTLEDLGNPITSAPDGWRIEASTWHVSPDSHVAWRS